MLRLSLTVLTLAGPGRLAISQIDEYRRLGTCIYKIILPSPTHLTSVSKGLYLFTIVSHRLPHLAQDLDKMGRLGLQFGVPRHTLKSHLTIQVFNIIRRGPGTHRWRHSNLAWEDWIRDWLTGQPAVKFSMVLRTYCYLWVVHRC